MEGLHVADVIAQIVDVEARVVTGQQRRADVAREQRARRLVEQENVLFMLGSLGATLLTILIGSVLSIRRVIKVEPAVVFAS